MLQEKQDKKASLTGFEKQSIFIPALNLAAGEAEKTYPTNSGGEAEKKGKSGMFSQYVQLYYLRIFQTLQEKKSKAEEKQKKKEKANRVTRDVFSMFNFYSSFQSYKCCRRSRTKRQVWRGLRSAQFLFQLWILLQEKDKQKLKKRGNQAGFLNDTFFQRWILLLHAGRWRRAQDQEGLTRQVKTSGGVNSWISNVQSVSPGNCDVDGLGEKFAQWCVGLFVWSVLTIQTDSARQETKLMKIRLQVVFSGSSHAAETVALSKLTLSDSLLCKGKTLQHRVAENEAKGEDTMSVRLGTLHYPYLRSSQLVSCWL